MAPTVPPKCRVRLAVRPRARRPDHSRVKLPAQPARGKPAPTERRSLRVGDQPTQPQGPLAGQEPAEQAGWGLTTAWSARAAGATGRDLNERSEFQASPAPALRADHSR